MKNSLRATRSKLITFLILLLPLLSTAQGVKFEEGLTWQQVKQKAKKENKYIFIDCYATWCVPCKKMDKEVYINDSVGNAVNEKFIAVKVQMDTSKKDDEFIKGWYADADYIRKLYSIKSYPSFLFLSPDGKLVHKGIGYKTTKQFISLAEDALNPSKQFFTLFRNYEKGIKNYKEMPELAIAAKLYLEDSSDKQIAFDYINNYLIKQKKKVIFTKSNIGFITQYCKSSKEKGFQLIYKNAEKVNKLLGRPEFAQSWIHFVISTEETQPTMYQAIKLNKSPDWEKLMSSIKEKYNSYYANRIVTDAKSRWYKATKEWDQFTKYTTEFVESYGKNMGDFELAVKSWDIFLYSNNKDELLQGLAWTRKILGRSTDSSNIIPNTLDTQANILYKISYLFQDEKSFKDALVVEERALLIATGLQNKSKIKGFTETLQKMKQSIPTWPKM